MKKRLIKFLKITGLTLTIILVLLALTTFLFMSISPQFGRKANDKQKQQYKQTGHYSEGKFLNEEEIIMEINCHSITSMLKGMLRPNPNVAPKENIEVLSIQAEQLTPKEDSSTQLSWLGHSSFIIKIEGKVLLIDPVFSQYAAPHPWLGRKRYNSKMPFEIENLAAIDGVILSHDHYDHLDYASITQLKNKTKNFYVPLGVGNHLREWGVEDTLIHELDWWEEIDLDSIQLALTPSRHMSGRGFTDQKATLLGSWVIAGNYNKIYFSGDGGYGKHFAEIGKKYGPFDIGLIECGQYNKLWKNVHMVPEESVQAAIDVQVKTFLPIHWGAFALSNHNWKEPVERAIRHAIKKQVKYTTPRIGEFIDLRHIQTPSPNWWKEYN